MLNWNRAISRKIIPRQKYMTPSIDLSSSSRHDDGEIRGQDPTRLHFGQRVGSGNFLHQMRQKVLLTRRIRPTLRPSLAHMQNVHSYLKQVWSFHYPGIGTGFPFTNLKLKCYDLVFSYLRFFVPFFDSEHICSCTAMAWLRPIVMGKANFSTAPPATASTCRCTSTTWTTTAAETPSTKASRTKWS